MLRFFSKLRRQLLNEGNFRTYLGYAVGELLLVVAGILIALQIDQWVGERRDQAFERETLAQIRTNLEADQAALRQIIANQRRAVEAVDSILAITDPDRPVEELPRWLGDVFQFERFFSITNAYAVLKSRGLDLISNQELRLTLGVYYDGLAREILMHNGDLEKSFFDHWVPRLIEDFESFAWEEAAVPRDPPSLLRDRRFLSTLRLERENHKGAADEVEKMLRVNEKLQAQIDAEIGR
jgi:hypothetical protein